MVEADVKLVAEEEAEEAEADAEAEVEEEAEEEAEDGTAEEAEAETRNVLAQFVAVDGFCTPEEESARFPANFTQVAMSTRGSSAFLEDVEKFALLAHVDSMATDASVDRFVSEFKFVSSASNESGETF